jgi:hypothetical protein
MVSKGLNPIIYESLSSSLQALLLLQYQLPDLIEATTQT